MDEQLYILLLNNSHNFKHIHRMQLNTFSILTGSLLNEEFFDPSLLACEIIQVNTPWSPC